MGAMLPESAPFVDFLIGVLAIAAAALAIGHALLFKRRPRAAFGWIAVCLVAPLFGPLLYFMFGVNRVRTRARKLQPGQHRDRPRRKADDLPPEPLRPLARLGAAVGDTALVAGNEVEVLNSGDAAYPRMLAAIERATQRVYLSTYLFDDDSTGRAFCAALERAAGRGVDVRLLLDGIGQFYAGPRLSKLLRKANFKVARFLPPKLLPPRLNLNLRNHRKILSVDADTAFTGGLNIGDRYLAESSADPKRVVDLHFRLRGPVAAQLQSIFLADWRFATGDGTETAMEAPEHLGSALCRSIEDGPDRRVDRLLMLMISCIGLAQRRVWIMTPYLLPPRELLGALQAASLRGVEVAILLPGLNNLPYVHRATRHMLWELAQRGVNLYYQPPPFVHSKLLIIDDGYAQIGSANLDTRSFRLNFELVVEVYDDASVSQLSRQFEDARQRSQQITLAELDARRITTRLLDGAAWLFSPYL